MLGAPANFHVDGLFAETKTSLSLGTQILNLVLFGKEIQLVYSNLFPLNIKHPQKHVGSTTVGGWDYQITSTSFIL